MQSQRRYRAFGALVSICLLATLGPSSATASLTYPYLSSQDAPFTRNQTVDLEFNRPLIDPPDVETYLASNELDANGQLVAPTAVSFHGPWTLTPGDGEKTVYGQMHYATDTWSAVMELDFILATEAGSKMAVDLDPQDSPVSPGIRLTGGHKWHEVSRSPTEPFYGAAQGKQSITVWNSYWRVYFSAASPLATGRYEIGPFDGNGNCIGNCADLVTVNWSSCRGTHAGWFEINSITFWPEGDSGTEDLRSVDVDFSILCRTSWVMAGTVLYGVERPLVALDQSAVNMTFDERRHVGTTSVEQLVTFTNIGDVPVEFGIAAVTGIDPTAADDYDISRDECSDTELPVGEICQVGLTFTPSARGARTAVLTLPENTARGARTIRLRGWGQEPLSISIDTPVVAAWPALTTIAITVTPPNAGAGLWLDGVQQFGPTVTQLSNPARTVYTYQKALLPGEHTALAQGGGSDFVDSGSAQKTITIEGTAPYDHTPPTGQIIISRAGPFTNEPNVTISFPGEDADSSVTYFGYTTSNWGMTNSSWVYIPYGPDTVTQDWHIPLDGPWVVRAKWLDENGNWSDTVDMPITLDTVAPAVDPPAQQLVAGTTVSGGKVVIRVPLAAEDSLSGVADVDLNQRTDNGSWANVPVPLPGVTITPAATSVDRLLAPGHAYTFRARGVDNATNSSDWATGQKLSLKVRQEANALVTYSGSWVKRSSTHFWGGAVRSSVKSGATAATTFTGRSLAWVTTYGPDRGRAEIYVNGVLAGTIDLYSPTVTNKVVAWAGNWSSSVARTVTIKVVSNDGRRVDVDAFVTAQ